MKKSDLEKSEFQAVSDFDTSQVQQYQKQLRRLASEMSLIEARERREIASDLHDHIGQALAYVSQKVNRLKGDVIFSGMESDFNEIVTTLEQTIRYTRNLTVEISPPVLYELGLSAAIDWLAERAAKRYNLHIKTKEKGSKQFIAENIKVFLFKSIQELIVNISKHAQAKKVNVTIYWNEKYFEVSVEDNGKGFNADSYLQYNVEHCCFGLFSIKERLSYIGGTMRIDSIIDKGTKVTITAPYSLKEEEND